MSADYWGQLEAWCAYYALCEAYDRTLGGSWGSDRWIVYPENQSRSVNHARRVSVRLGLKRDARSGVVRDRAMKLVRTFYRRSRTYHEAMKLVRADIHRSRKHSRVA